MTDWYGESLTPPAPQHVVGWAVLETGPSTYPHLVLGPLDQPLTTRKEATTYAQTLREQYVGTTFTVIQLVKTDG